MEILSFFQPFQPQLIYAACGQLTFRKQPIHRKPHDARNGGRTQSSLQARTSPGLAANGGTENHFRHKSPSLTAYTDPVSCSLIITRNVLWEIGNSLEACRTVARINLVHFMSDEKARERSKILVPQMFLISYVHTRLIPALLPNLFS